MGYGHFLSPAGSWVPKCGPWTPWVLISAAVLPARPSLGLPLSWTPALFLLRCCQREGFQCTADYAALLNKQGRTKKQPGMTFRCTWCEDSDSSAGQQLPPHLAPPCRFCILLSGHCHAFVCQVLKKTMLSLSQEPDTCHPFAEPLLNPT